MKQTDANNLTQPFAEFIREHDEQMQTKYINALKVVLAAFVEKSESEYLTIEETAKLLKLSKPTVHSLRKAGKLKAYLINTRVRYRKDEISDFIKSN